MFNKKILIAASFLLAGSFHSAMAQGVNAIGLNGMQRYVDFSATSPFSNHQFFGTWSVGTTNPGSTKFFNMLFQGKSTGSCFVVITSPASASASVTDIVAYAGTKKIDDDGPNSSKLPYFKVFTYHDTFIYLSAKDNTHNNRDWNIQTDEHSPSTETECKNLFNNPSVPMYSAQTDAVNPGPTTAN